MITVNIVPVFAVFFKNTFVLYPLAVNDFVINGDDRKSNDVIQNKRGDFPKRIFLDILMIFREFFGLYVVPGKIVVQFVFIIPDFFHFSFL